MYRIATLGCILHVARLPLFRLAARRILELSN